jgi:hypothetical protein
MLKNCFLSFGYLNKERKKERLILASPFVRLILLNEPVKYQNTGYRIPIYIFRRLHTASCANNLPDCWSSEFYNRYYKDTIDNIIMYHVSCIIMYPVWV